jgi:hypothetical protein
MNPRLCTMKLWSRTVTGYLSNGLGSAAFVLIAIAILAGGCNHRRSKNDGNTTAAPAVSRVSQTLVGNRITIRGKLILFKCGPAIQIDDGEVVCLEAMHPKPVDTPYPGMFDKLVEATGTLRFFHNPKPIEAGDMDPEQDHYYFEEETTQVRLIGH